MRLPVLGLALAVVGCATVAPPDAATSPVALSPPAVTPEPTKRWARPDPQPARACDVEERLMGPITAAASFGGRRIACRTGPSPEWTFQSLVHRSVAVKECLRQVEGSGFVDLEVTVSASGQVTGVEVVDSDSGGVSECAAWVLLVPAPPAGCRWTTQVHLAVLRSGE